MSCDCPRCRRIPTADPKFGFDRAKVKSVHCVLCDKPIGRRRYQLVTALARFGQMFFVHATCEGRSR